MRPFLVSPLSFYFTSLFEFLTEQTTSHLFFCWPAPLTRESNHDVLSLFLRGHFLARACHLATIVAYLKKWSS